MIAAQALGHRYGEVEVLRDLDLAVAPGEFLVVIGPSGCGKTTLLRLLAGHLPPSEGRMDREGSSRMIHQSGGLFPWLSVRENIALGGAGGDELIRLVGLEGFEDSPPHQLSGGMKQRVELARALASGADILLLDEPFAALDYQTRLRMRRELLAALEARPRTVVLVTHDIDDAVCLADRVVVLSPRPATVECEIALDGDRPRDPGDPQVIAAVKELRARLRLE